MPKKFPSDVLKNKKLNIGFDPKLYTEYTLKRLFNKSHCNLIPINKNLINEIKVNKYVKKLNKFYKISDKYTGLSSKNKVKKLTKILGKNKIDFQFVSSAENIAWLLNLRGADSEFSPIPNSYLILNSKNKVYFFCDLKKIDNKLKKSFKNIKIINIKYIDLFLMNVKNKIIQLDNVSCSIFFKSIIKKK